MEKPKLPIVLTIILAVFLLFNQWQITLVHNLMPEEMTPGSVAQLNDTAPPAPAIDLAAIARQILPFGVPPAYGAELNVSFDSAATAIPVLAQYEQDTRPDKLTGEKLERYIRIGQMTSCEFCCGARTMVFPDGRKACACAHSAAMRGVVAYLLENTDMSDQEILNEANKWKAVFFPGPMVQKVTAANGLISPAAKGSESQGLKQQVGGC